MSKKQDKDRDLVELAFKKKDILGRDWGYFPLDHLKDIDELKKWLKQERLNYKGFAKTVGVSEVTVKDWMCGKRPVPEYALKILHLVSALEDFKHLHSLEETINKSLRNTIKSMKNIPK